MVFGDEARQQNEWSRVARITLLLFLLFMSPVNTTSANDQPHDFSSLPPYIDTTSASSKAPKSQIKRCCWRTLRHEFQARQTACSHACHRPAAEAPLRFTSSIIKSGTYTLRAQAYRQRKAGYGGVR